MNRWMAAIFCSLWCGGFAALDFSDYDAGGNLPEDRIYPQGRIFPYSGFQVPDVKDIKSKGFTLAGPAYGTNQAIMLNAAVELGFPVIYTIRGEQNGQAIDLKLLDSSITVSLSGSPMKLCLPTFKPDVTRRTSLFVSYTHQYTTIWTLKILEWGNSLALRVGRGLAEASLASCATAIA